MESNASLTTTWARRRRGAVVLCGGKSRRMGEDKAWLPFGNEAMLQRVVRVVAESVPVGNIIVVAGRNQELPQLPEKVRIIRDGEEFRGPLPAVIAGLNESLDTSNDVFVTSCDVPLLRSAVVDWLFWQLDRNRTESMPANERPYEAVVPRDAHRAYPLTAVYEVSARVGLSAWLSRGERSLQQPISNGLVKAAAISVDEMRTIDPELDSLFNCNSWYDYESAVERMAERL